MASTRATPPLPRSSLSRVPLSSLSLLLLQGRELRADGFSATSAVDILSYVAHHCDDISVYFETACVSHLGLTEQIIDLLLQFLFFTPLELCMILKQWFSNFRVQVLRYHWYFYWNDGAARFQACFL